MQTTIDLYRYFRFTIDRVGYTISSPTLFAIGKEGCRFNAHPKAVTAYIEKRVRGLKNKGYGVKLGREPDRGKKGRGIKAAYIDWEDPIHGEASLRVRNWRPYTMILYLNGHRALQKYCDWKGLDYSTPKGIDNAFIYLAMTKEEVLDVLLYVLDPRKVYERLIKPKLEQFFPWIAEYYVRVPTINQLEASHDIPVESKEVAIDTLIDLALSNQHIFQDMTFKKANGMPFWNVQQENGLQFHAYVKERNVRFEYTLNKSYLDRYKINRRNPLAILEDADKHFKRLAAMVNKVKYRRIVPSKKLVKLFRAMVYSEKDVLVLKRMLARAGSQIKNEDIQGEELTRNQVYYRFKKFQLFLYKASQRIWKVKPMAKHLIEHLLGLVEECCHMIEDMLGGEKEEHLSILLDGKKGSMFKSEALR